MKFSLTLLLTLVLAACSGGAAIDTKRMGDSLLSKHSGLDQKSARYLTKAELVYRLCDNQSFRHNEQRIITRSSPVITYFNSITGAMEVAVVPESQQTIVYDSKTPPFDMQACLVEGMKTGWERLAVKFLDFGKVVLKYGAVYALLDKAVEKVGQGTSITGDNNIIRSVDGTNNTVTEAGGLPPESFETIELVPEVEEPESLETEPDPDPVEVPETPTDG